MIRIFIYMLVISLALGSCKEKKPEKEIVPEEPASEVKEPVKQEKTLETVAQPVKKPEPLKIHIVKQDEWLWDISRKEYGTALGWFKIYEANKDKIKDPDLIYPGQEFVIPEFKKK